MNDMSFLESRQESRTFMMGISEFHPGYPMTRSLFRAYSTGEDVPNRIVSKMNKDLTENNENCMFVTFFVGDTEHSDDLTMLCIRLI